MIIYFKFSSIQINHTNYDFTFQYMNVRERKDSKRIVLKWVYCIEIVLREYFSTSIKKSVTFPLLKKNVNPSILPHLPPSGTFFYWIWSFQHSFQNLCLYKHTFKPWNIISPISLCCGMRPRFPNCGRCSKVVGLVVSLSSCTIFVGSTTWLFPSFFERRILVEKKLFQIRIRQSGGKKASD